MNVRIVGENEEANFNIYVANRANYVATVRKHVERSIFTKVLGMCMVKSHFSPKGITRSNAVIVADEGAKLFRRCLVEEILQGLGPLNENTSLDKSIFNDTSKHTKFTDFGQLIMNMLYDKRVKNGDSLNTVSKVLDEVLSDAKRRLGL